MSLPDTCAGAALLRVVLVTVLGALPARPPSTAQHGLLKYVRCVENFEQISQRSRAGWNVST